MVPKAATVKPRRRPKVAGSSVEKRKAVRPKRRSKCTSSLDLDEYYNYLEGLNDALIDENNTLKGELQTEDGQTEGKVVRLKRRRSKGMSLLELEGLCNYIEDHNYALVEENNRLNRGAEKLRVPQKGQNARFDEAKGGQTEDEQAEDRLIAMQREENRLQKEENEHLLKENHYLEEVIEQLTAEKRTTIDGLKQEVERVRREYSSLVEEACRSCEGWVCCDRESDGYCVMGCGKVLCEACNANHLQKHCILEEFRTPTELPPLAEFLGFVRRIRGQKGRISVA